VGAKFFLVKGYAEKIKKLIVASGIFENSAKGDFFHKKR
jgi:hypothetical protein